jgi:3-methylfumaryl-CoA hydratase
MSTPPAALSLVEYVRDWHPASVEMIDSLPCASACHLASTLNISESFSDGDELPLLWECVYFQEWPSTKSLGADGHPQHGRFLPPIPNRRRMFAGGRTEVHSPLKVGEHTTRTSMMTSATVKQGRAGDLLFVTVRHQYTQRGALCLTEEHDLVYRSDDETSQPFVRRGEPAAESDGLWSATVITHPTLLFRFSALTANSHRIHYDEHYTTQTEGFPGLVVHGPLLALYMAELLRSQCPDRRVRSFDFRLRAPVFVGEPIEVRGKQHGAGPRLDVVSRNGMVHATATARVS